MSCRLPDLWYGKTRYMGFASYESAECEMAGLTRLGVMQSAELASMQRMQRQLAAQQAAMQQQLREAQAAAQAAQRAVAQVPPDLLLLCARCVADWIHSVAIFHADMRQRRDGWDCH